MLPRGEEIGGAKEIKIEKTNVTCDNEILVAHIDAKQLFVRWEESSR